MKNRFFTILLTAVLLLLCSCQSGEPAAGNRADPVPPQYTEADRLTVRDTKGCTAIRFTAEDEELFLRLMTEGRFLRRADGDLPAILCEEAENCLSGQNTARQAAEYVRSRAGFLLSERS